jgi:hypothetical protein
MCKVSKSNGSHFVRNLSETEILHYLGGALWLAEICRIYNTLDIH